MTYEKEIKNIEEYMLLSLSVCGEIKALNIGQRFPFSDTYVLRQMTEMLDKGLIRKYEYDDGKFYRLAEKGATKLMGTPPAAQHLDLMVGPKGDRYKGAKEKRKRKRHTYEVASMALLEGMTVDFVKLTDKDVNYGYEEKNISEYIKKIDPEEKTFLTKRLLQELNTNVAAHPRNHMFRTVGIFFSGGNIFPAYYMASPGEKYWHDVELGFIGYLTKEVKANYPLEVDRYSGIFYTGKEKTLMDYLFPDKKVYRFQPGTIYNIFYMIPIGVSGPVTNLILTDRWKEKTNGLLIESPGGRIEDGTTLDKTPVYNLLGNNISLMKRLIPNIKSKRSVLIIHDWQEEIVKRLYGDNNELRVVETDMLRNLIADIT